MLLDEWLARAQSLGASDLHLESDTAIVVRIRGELQTLGAAVGADRLRQMAQDLLGAEGWAQLRTRGSADLAVTRGALRCRASFYQTLRGLGIAVRLLSPSVKDLRACNLHPDFHRLIQADSALVLFSGPTGAGKSTTLAALLEELNASSTCQIITLESPLEYLFANRRSFIRQREIPTHCPSFEQGIVDALRENPDVLVIGELRTPEVMRLTLNAAETGHLVLATIHSATCTEALSRICLSFPAELQAAIRGQLADCLVGVSCQRLDILAAQQLRVPRCELLLASSGTRGTIRSGNFAQIANVLQSGADEGMWSFARYQRWMEQFDDWVQPVPATSASGGAESVASAASPLNTPAPASSALIAGLGAAISGTAGARAPPTAPLSSAPAPEPTEDIIEVPSEEMGLAELARRVVERKP